MSHTTELECIHHHLTGLGRTNPLRLADVASYSGWARLARIELESRKASVLLGFTDAELDAIASGRIHLEQEAGEVLEGLKA